MRFYDPEYYQRLYQPGDNSWTRRGPAPAYLLLRRFGSSPMAPNEHGSQHGGLEGKANMHMHRVLRSTKSPEADDGSVGSRGSSVRSAR